MSILYGKHGDKLLLLSGGIKVKIKDPYDGGQVLRDSSRELLFDWCYENCEGHYWIGMGFGEFELESDSILFMLRWK